MDRQLSCEAIVGFISFSASGDAIHGLCADRKLRTWDVKSGAIRQTIALDTGDANPVLSATAVTVVGQDGAIKTWDIATGKVVRRVTPAGPRSGRTVAGKDFTVSNIRTGPYAAETKVRVVDTTGKEKFTVPAGLGGVAAFAISPDGNAVVASSYDADVRAWNSRNGELLRLVDELDVTMFDLKFSPDGKWLVAGGPDRTVYIYDTKTWRQSRKIAGLPEMVSALSFSADGKLLASGGFQEITLKHPVKVIVWDFATGKQLRTFDAPHRVNSLSLSPDGKLVAAATGEKFINLWQVSE